MEANRRKGAFASLLDSSLEAELEAIRSPILTQRAINSVLGLCAFGIAALALVAYKLETGAAAFFAWSMLCALAATLAGGALGLLFALPGRRQAGVAVAAGGSAAAAVPGGYEESTSLEQIADWLTKIIVGLTLTQYSTWAAAFDRLALRVTHDLLCPTSAASCGYVPGGVLVTAYFLGGFVIAYLWVRRFFILEMVTRDRAIDDLMRAQQQRAEAAKEGRVQGGDPQTEGRADYTDVITAIVEDGKKNAMGAAKTTADAIKPGTDVDDPWRGAFGGQNATDKVALNASVTPVLGDPRNFNVEISIAGLTPQTQRQLAGQKALVYLHPTFGREVRVISFGADGKASLVLYAYGAFTVGALLEDGTKLELNLATLPGAPNQFKIS